MNSTLQDFIGKMYTWLVNLTLAAAILAFAIAAIMYLTSSGSADKIKKAQSYLSNAIIALVIVGFASTFFAFLSNIPGAGPAGSAATSPFDVFIFIKSAFGQATTVILEVGTALAGLLVAYSGVLYILAAGDATKQQKAIKSLTTTVTGLAIILAFWALKNFIIDYLQYSTENTTVPSAITNFAPGS